MNWRTAFDNAYQRSQFTKQKFYVYALRDRNGGPIRYSIMSQESLDWMNKYGYGFPSFTQMEENGW